jgi:predicted transposase/invertase (TIGR01784 family)
LTKAYAYEKNDIPQELAVDENVKKAIEMLDIMYLGKDEREIYEIEEKKRMDDYEVFRTAMSKATAEGKAEGKAEGEKLKALEMAKKMLAKNRPLDEIVDFTGLTISEIEQIRNNS